MHAAYMILQTKLSYRKIKRNIYTVLLTWIHGKFSPCIIVGVGVSKYVMFAHKTYIKLSS